MPIDTLSVCILEDNEDLIYFYKDILSSEGYQIMVARNLQEFKTLLHPHKPHLLLADHSLNDGLLLDWIKLENLQLMKEIPTMIVSANATLEMMEASYQLGARDYIIKPFRREELLAKIRHTMKHREFTVHHQVLSSLTLTERKIFEVLSAEANQFISRQKLESTVWPEGDVGKKTLTVHLKNIRQKLQRSTFSIQYRLGKGWKLITIQQ